MLVNLKTLLEDARINHYAVAGFTTPTIDTCEAVLQAAEDMNAPVVIGQAQLYEEFGPIEKFGPVMAHMAEQAKVPVCLHLDHGTSIDYIMKAMKAGYTSVMADFSHLDFEENARIVKMYDCGKAGPGFRPFDKTASGCRMRIGYARLFRG